MTGAPSSTPPVRGGAYELVLADGARVPLGDTVTLGRAPDSTVLLADASVSRRHAWIAVEGDVPVLHDAGSRHGTWVDGERVGGPVALRDGARIRLGDAQLVVERVRRESEAGLTVVVSDRGAEDDGEAGGPPRLRSGYALKRLEASERPYRWVLRDLRSERFLRLTDEDGRLLDLLDGRRSVLELLGDADERFGPGASARMAGLLPELAERGFLAGVERVPGAGETAPGRRARLLAPREKVWPDAGGWFDALYRDGGRRLLTRPALGALAGVAAAGFLAFAYLVLGRYGTPFVVASKIGLGGLVFLVARLTVAAVHEGAHGLVMASFGRRVGRAGLKLVLIFPYVFVDTSEVWFEPRRRRIAVSAAGPVSDAVLGGVFALCSLALGAGVLRDILFQVAFAAYVGALVNLNPFVERDGYHILADVLREPALRRRARAELARRLRREQSARGSPVLVRYAVAGLAWSVLAAAGAAVVSLRYGPVLRQLLPAPVVWVMLVSVWVGALTPVLAAVGGPLLGRLRGQRLVG